MLQPATKTYPDGYHELDVTISPAVAFQMVSDISPQSYHWTDHVIMDNGRLEEYIKVLKDGKWEPQLFSNNMAQHPIRFDSEDQLSHGLIRLLAICRSDVPMQAALVLPPDSKWLDYFKDDSERTDV
jgi:hypothetical protein